MKGYRIITALFMLFGVMVTQPLTLAERTRLTPTVAPGDINVIWGLSEDTVFIGYSNGDISHWDGETWHDQRAFIDPYDRESINGIWGSSPDNIWAVGTHEHDTLITHWDGTEWVDSTAVFAGELYDIWGTDPDNIIAVGYLDGDDVCLRYNGESWVKEETGCSSLTSIWGFDADNVFAVGGMGGVAHWDGTTWNTMGHEISWPNDIWGTSPGNVYLVTAYAEIWHWDGASWTEMDDLGNAEPTCIWGTSPTDVYVGSEYYSYGRANVFHFDGVAWEPTCVRSVKYDINSIWGSSSANVIAVGDDGLYLQYDGTGWSDLNQGIKTSIFDIIVTDEDEMYISGADGLVAYKEKNMTRYFGYVHCSDACIVGQDQLMAISSGRILTGDFGNWELIRDDKNFSYLKIAPGLENTAYILDTSNGLHYWDGQDLRLIHHFETENLTDIWSTRNGTIYLSGGDNENGVLIKGDGQNWDIVDVPDLKWVRNIWGTDEDNIYVIDSEKVLHWDGLTWSTQTFPDGVYVTKIWGLSAEELFAVGTTGYVGRWDGNNWITQSTPTTEQLASIAGNSLEDIVAVGVDGTIIYWDGNTWSIQDSGTEEWLSYVFVTPDGHYLISGHNGVSLAKIDDSWRQMFYPYEENIYGIWVSDSEQIFTVGDGGAFTKYDNGYWHILRPEGSISKSLRSVWGSSGNDVHGVGDFNLYYDGETVTIDESQEFKEKTGIWGASVDDIYSVGENNTHHWDGNSWTEKNSYDLTHVWGLDAENIYGVTYWDGYVGKWDGTYWKQFGEKDENMGFNDVWGSSPDNLFLIQSSSAFKFWNGTDLTLTAPKHTYGIRCVDGISDKTFYMAGAGGVILKQIFEALTVTLNMPDHHFDPGNPCWLKAKVCNSDSKIEDAAFFTILDAFGELFFYPSWCHYPYECPSSDYELFTFRSGTTNLTLLPEFVWPDTGNSPGELVFYSAVVDLGSSKIIGNMDSWAFTY